MRIRSAFGEIFCLRSNLRNEDITSALTPGLKTVKDFRGRGLKTTGVENGIFWSEIGSGFGEPGCTTLPRIPRSTPPPRIENYKIRERISGLKRLSTVSTGSRPFLSLSSRFFHPFPKLGYQT